MRRAAATAFVTTALQLAATTAAAEAPRLGLPLDCVPGRTCFIQHYVDTDPGTSAQDFRCGHTTYDGHTGVDFRVLSAAAAKVGIAVLAASAGVVKGRRDGMTDEFPREKGRDGIKGRECGNGVVIDHGDGWETQYCHLRQGSVRVTTGQKVERGMSLGEVGYSGLADSAHLHLTVRHNGQIIDPFTGRTPDKTCARDGSTLPALFDDAVASLLPYRAGDILQTGFINRTVGWAELEHDHESGSPVTKTSDALIFFARLMHLKGGDRIRLIVTSPSGIMADVTSEPVDRNKAIYLSHAGKRRTTTTWAAGVYKGEARLIRDGVDIRVALSSVTIAE